MTANNSDNYIPLSKLNTELAGQQLDEASLEQQLVAKRIEAFNNAVWCCIAVIIVLGVVLVGTIIKYLCNVIDGSIPDNYWHIPLMLCILISTLLGLLLSISAKFGSKDAQTSQADTGVNTLKEHLPVIKDLMELVKSK